MDGSQVEYLKCNEPSYWDFRIDLDVLLFREPEGQATLKQKFNTLLSTAIAERQSGVIREQNSSFTTNSQLNNELPTTKIRFCMGLQ